jgi:hypothetical protein
MIGGGAAYGSKERRLPALPGRSPAVLLLGLWAHVGSALAADAVDCASINLGRLDVALASGSSTFRTVEVNEGDTLAFTFRGDTYATGTITLVAGDGREQRLLHGPHATQVSYTAERSGAVRFRLATLGGKVATFITTCHPAHGSGAMVPDGLNVDLRAPLSFGATVLKDSAGASVITPNAPTLQWVGGEQSGKEAPASTSSRYGVNLKVQPTLMVGFLAQFDQASDPLLGVPALSEQPWVAGPVMSVLLGSGLSLDARAAWGLGDPLTGHAANRQAFDARLTSKQEAGPWRFSPSVGFAVAQEKLGTVGAGASDVLGLQTAESGRVEVRPEMAYRIDMGQSLYIEPKIMVGTFWSLGDATMAHHEPRGMAETGVTFGTAGGTQLQVGAGVEEGETRSETVWTGKVQLNIPLK